MRRRQKLIEPPPLNTGGLPAVRASPTSGSIPPFVSAKTLGALLECSESTVWDYADREVLPPPISIGNLVRWRWDEVLATILTGRAACGGEDENKDKYLMALNDGTKTQADH